MEDRLPDYSRCIVNLVSSVLSFYGVPPLHSTLSEVDRVLKRGPRTVTVLLLDGLGAENLMDASPKGFLASRVISRLSSVFPSTTVSATTSFATGLTPGEHGWLGWTLYFSQLRKNVEVFSNRQQFQTVQASGFHAATRYLPYRRASDLLRSVDGLRTHWLSAFTDAGIRSYDDLLAQIHARRREPGRHLIQAYWNEPDATMHRLGCEHSESLEMIRALDRKTEAFSRGLGRDDRLFITADHGMIDAQPLFIEDHPWLESMLKRAPSIEPRAAAFHIWRTEASRFPGAFREAFGDAFRLMLGEEAIDRGLFGPPPYRAELPSLVGDAFAVAEDQWSIFLKREHCRLIGMHAGLTVQEMRVPLMLAH